MSFVSRLWVLLLAGIMFLAADGVLARVAHYEGDCVPGGGNWSMAVTIDDNTGKVTRREGIDCYGNKWVDHCTVVTGGLGATSDYYIVDTAPLPRWWVRLNVSASGVITGMWGQDADGVKWVAETGNGDDDSLE